MLGLFILITFMIIHKIKKKFENFEVQNLILNLNTIVNTECKNIDIFYLFCNNIHCFVMGVK